MEDEVARPKKLKFVQETQVFLGSYARRLWTSDPFTKYSPSIKLSLQR